MNDITLPTGTILVGDALTRLRELPDCSVHMVCTSPPYFGLRDYGTAEWEGGDINHMHVPNVRNGAGRADGKVDERGQRNRDGVAGIEKARHCSCGAVRIDAQIGMEPTPDAFIANLVAVFRECRRVLRDDGTLWVVIGDSYNSVAGNYRGITQGMKKAETTCTLGGGMPLKAHEYDARPTLAPGCKPKDLIGIPWMLAFALRADGWFLRQDIIWHKPNPMPESVQGCHYSRHRVTIREYERLSGLRYIDERAGEDWAGDMPDLSERETVSDKAPLSAERQGQGNLTCAGGTRGCAGEAPSVQSIRSGQAKPGEVRCDGKGQSHACPNDGEIPFVGESQTASGRISPANERRPNPQSATQGIEQQVCQNPEREGTLAPPTCATEGRYSLNLQPPDGDGLAGDCNGEQGALLLLQEAETPYDGSCDSFEQGRRAHEDEHSPSVPVVQLEEEQSPDLPHLVGCPGCPKCIQHHGYIFHMSAGRCTKSHEYVFLLSKTARYFYDAAAIAEQCEPCSKNRNGFRGENDGPTYYANQPAFPNNSAKFTKREGPGSGMHVSRTAPDSKSNSSRAAIRNTGGGFSRATHEARRVVISGGETSQRVDTGWRNKRDVWTVATEAFSEAHFATFPKALIRPMILAGCKLGGTVLDPFLGSGTTGLVAVEEGRRWMGCELNPEYALMAKRRIMSACPGLPFDDPAPLTFTPRVFEEAETE